VRASHEGPPRHRAVSTDNHSDTCYVRAFHSSRLRKNSVGRLLPSQRLAAI
jgi:hypothetical protein